MKSPSGTKAFAQSAFAKLAIIGVNAATGIIVARSLTLTGRGELSAMMLWYIFLANAFTLGIPSALTYQIRSAPDRASASTGAALLLSLCISTLAAIAGYWGIPHWIPQYSASVIFFSRVFLLNTPIAAFFVVARNAVESRDKFTVSNLSLTIPPTLTLIALIALRLSGRFSATNAAWCYVLAGLPSFWFMWRSLSVSLTPSLDDFWRSAKSLLSYGIRSYGIDLCGTMALYVDQALVVRLLLPSMMGTYVVALSLSRLLNAFHTSVVMVLFPKAVARPPAEVIAMTGKAVRLSTLLTAMGGILIILAGPHLLALLYGSEYRGAGSILRILVIEVVLSGATQVLSQAFMALGRPGIVTMLQAFGLALTIPLMLVFIPRFGIAGAALALLISTIARFSFVLVSFPAFLKLPRPKLLLSREDFHTIALSGRGLRRRMHARTVNGEVG